MASTMAPLRRRWGPLRAEMRRAAVRAPGRCVCTALAGKTVTEILRHYAALALWRNNGNRKDAARELGIGERTLYRWIKERAAAGTPLRGVSPLGEVDCE